MPHNRISRDRRPFCKQLIINGSPVRGVGMNGRNVIRQGLSPGDVDKVIVRNSGRSFESPK